MNQETFWDLIEETKAGASGKFQRHAGLLQKELVKLSYLMIVRHKQLVGVTSPDRRRVFILEKKHEKLYYS